MASPVNLTPPDSVPSLPLPLESLKSPSNCQQPIVPAQSPFILSPATGSEQFPGLEIFVLNFQWKRSLPKISSVAFSASWLKDIKYILVNNFFVAGFTLVALT